MEKGNAEVFAFDPHNHFRGYKNEDDGYCFQNWHRNMQLHERPMDLDYNGKTVKDTNTPYRLFR